MLESVAHDFRYVARTLRKQPGFALLVATTLALGIGANTSIFSVVNGVLLRPLSYNRPEQLYLIHEIIPQWARSYPVLGANLADFQIWRRESHSFDDIAIAERTSMVFIGAAESEQLLGTRASANFLARWAAGHFVSFFRN